MYIPTVFTTNARLISSHQDARTQVFFGPVKSNNGGRSRRNSVAEGQIERETFLGRIHEATKLISIHCFQGITGGHFLHRAR